MAVVAVAMQVRRGDPVTRAVGYLSAHHAHRVVLYIAFVTTLTLLIQIIGPPWSW